MRLRFTNPWWVVVGAVTGLFVCNGPVLGFTFGVFLKPIMADTGWSRGSVSFALSVGGIFSAVAVPILGRMMDRWSIRRVALPGLVVYAVCLGLVGLSPPMFWIFTVMFVLAETTSAIQTPLGYAKAISAWFDARRGLALGIAMAGVGFGGSVIPQLANFLIERIGWRGAYASLAVLTLAIAFPAVALWIREPRPGEGERHFPVSSAGLPGLTIREAARRSRFWILAAVFFLVAIAINGTVAHVIPLLTDRGFSRGTATAIFGLFGLATLAGRLLAGYMVDRIFAPYVASVFFLAPIAGLVFLVSAAGPLPAVGVVLFGLGLGTEIDLIAFLVSRYFGQRAFGELYGCFFMVFGLGSSAGRVIGGYVFDLTRSYNAAFLGAGVALIAAVLLINRLGPYAYPVHRHIAPGFTPEPAAP
ncbi:MAG TPA: MFS transporter [Stellaceae bacterium]|jgi:predicted MFS family arabinose efflux permease|nr:MFS transporter [Stellaceae bacterium]